MEENIKKRRTNETKKKRLNVLDIITIVVVIVLLVIYAPRAWSLYEQRKEMLEEAKKEKVIEYPLEVEITEEDAKFFVNFFKDYAVGIRADINFLDDITENEMIDFARAILSEKYSSSGVISKTAMDNALKKYFDVSDLDYTKLGYKTLGVYKEYDAQKVFNVIKLMQLEKDGNLYLAYADCIDKNNVQDGTYKKENIEDVYMFTFEKKVEEVTTESITNREVSYILKKVQKVETVDENISDEKNMENVKE